MSTNSTESKKQPETTGFPIAGIGASAGGLEALRNLFRSMPPHTGIGFVLVQHLDPTHESLMADLLTKYTPIPVVQVTDGMQIQPNRIHVIPPNAALTVSDGILHLSEPTARRGMRMPIDQFFISLADDQQERSIGIVLSGTGTDGTSGVGMIKARGGMLMAQDPATAIYDGMPRSAIAAGHVDYVLPVEEMPDVLVSYVQHFWSRGAAVPADKQDEDYVKNILALIRARQDYDFRCYKRGTLHRRILRRMGLNHITKLAQYHARLRQDDQELRALTKDLLIGVTGFFREPEAWEVLRAKVLPELLSRHRKDEQIRVWVPGCATGEEAYSVAMSAAEVMDAAGRGSNLVVFATDVDKQALEVARAGVYPKSMVADITPERLARFFNREGDNVQVKKFLRERVIVAPQNLVADPPFSNIDLISCRNLLIYIEAEYQERLMALFHFALTDGGFLFLGSSETVGQEQGLFAPLSKKWRIYRRVDAATPRTLDFPMPAEHRRAPLGPALGGRAQRRARGYGPITHKALVERFTPAAVLVDLQDRVLYYHGAVRDYIGPTPGDPSEDILSLTAEGLRGKLRRLLRRAAAEGQPATARGAHVRRGEQWYTVMITVTPLRDGDQEGHCTLLLVTFEDERKTGANEGAEGARERSDDPALGLLEDELRSTREELRSTVEQMETSNEELKASNEEIMSMNEELQSTNEELETSKEELQSLNEELTTLNSQLEDKVRELEDTNNDLSNLLVSTNIATLFLDRRLHIRRYTPAATRLLSLIPSDIGRAITDITCRFDDPKLLDDARRVLAGMEVDQQEVCTEDRSWYLRRVLPYRTDEEPAAGVVMTFTEITERKHAELALAQSERALRRITDALPVLISYVDQQGRYRFTNATHERWFRVARAELQGKRVVDVTSEAAFQVIRPYLERALGGEPVEYDAWVPYEPTGTLYVHAEYIPDQNEAGEVAGVFVLVSDNTERRRNEEAIEQLHAENRARLAEMRALFDAAPIGIFVGRDPACDSMVMNRAGAEMLRLSGSVNPSMTGPDASALPFRVFHQGRELSGEELPMQVATRSGETVRDFEEELVFEDGEVRTLLTYAAPLADAAGSAYGCVGTFVDITAPKEAERRHRETLERLKLHIDNTPVAALEWVSDETILRWSPAAERMFGWTEEQALGRSVKELGLVHEEDRERVAEVMGALVSGAVERNKTVNRNRHKNGDIVWCEWFNSVLRDERGRFVSVLSLAMDVTERQALEANLRRQAQQLAEADRRKDEFLSMLGHELRNPLAPVRNALQLLALHREDRSTMDWAHRVIDRQTQHLENLVDDLLDVARITRGAIRLKREPLDLAAAIREALETTDALVQERGHRVEVELPEQPVIVEADATRLVQVMVNLLNNAAKYTEQGGLIRVSLVPTDDGTARITVEDNGRGIAVEALPYIFDTFSQGQYSFTRADGGLGLGLTLVKQLVTLHEGTVEADSAGPGKGSRFVVTLPVDSDPAAAQLRPEPPADPPAPGTTDRKKRILIVDDNVDVIESSKALLMSMGHDAWGVVSGAKALEAVQDIQPDVVLLDIGLKDIDGVEVARRLAGLPYRRSMKVVCISGYSESVVGAEAGLFDAHLLKPARLDRLNELLDLD
jgi:two-component system CheB/CheR fusion protein